MRLCNNAYVEEIIMLKAVFFDLDGTLLPMNEEEFIKVYFKNLFMKVADRGYKFDEFVKVIWNGTFAMYQNDGKRTNDVVFWEVFEKFYGKERLKDKEIFDDFYKNEFKATKSVCKDNDLAKSIVKYAKEKTGICILATNPIFPGVGTQTRMGFVGLEMNDFDFVTVYENSSFCKPNPAYLITLLKKYNLKPEEVIMFGNNDVEDYECAKNAGISCYLVDGFVIKHEDKNINCPIVKMDEVISIIDKEYELRK